MNADPINAKNKSTTNGAKIKTETPKDTTFKCNLLEELTHSGNF